MLFVTLFLFASITTFWVLTLVNNEKQYQVILIDNLEIPLGKRVVKLNELNRGLLMALDWLGSFTVRSVLLSNFIRADFGIYSSFLEMQ
jgi:hypothetical protein